MVKETIKNILFNHSYICSKIMHRFKNTKCKITKKILQRKLILTYGIHIGYNIIFEGIPFFPHPSSIVLGDGVFIEENCTIYQNVTIGGKMINGTMQYPHLESNITIYPGAVIIGNVRVRKGCIIAPNAVLITDTEPLGIYSGNPAKLIKNL